MLIEVPVLPLPVQQWCVRHG